MGVGLPLAGMAAPKATSHFFDLSLLFNGKMASYAPGLAVVFGAALIVHGALFWGVVKKAMKKPFLGEIFNIPTNKLIDFPLVSGAAMFGTGWALSGYCPGPVMTASFSGQVYPVWVAAWMFMGFGAIHFWRAYKQYSSHHEKGLHGLWTAVAQHGTIEYLAALGAVLGINFLSQGSAHSLNLLSGWNPLSIQALGGGIIGLNVGLMMIFNGQILGLSGIMGGLVNPLATDKWIRFLFVLGAGVGSLLAQRFLDVDMTVLSSPSAISALGGILVGAGAALANGCTSGHGICGMTRLSPRSIVATATFFAAALGVSTLFKTSQWLL
jgi:uncharacterized protein